MSINRRQWLKITAGMGAGLALDDLGVKQAITAKYFTLAKKYPNNFWVDLKVSDDGKKALKLASGDTLEWRPQSQTDKSFTVVVTTVAANHLKAREVKDPADDVGGTKTVVFSEAYDLTGVPAALVDIAHNPGNKLSSKKTATFVVDNGAWKLQSIN